jgi:hypothetical protein
MENPRVPVSALRFGKGRRPVRPTITASSGSRPTVATAKNRGGGEEGPQQPEKTNPPRGSLLRAGVLRA